MRHPCIIGKVWLQKQMMSFLDTQGWLKLWGYGLLGIFELISLGTEVFTYFIGQYLRSLPQYQSGMSQRHLFEPNWNLTKHKLFNRTFCGNIDWCQPLALAAHFLRWCTLSRGLVSFHNTGYQVYSITSRVCIYLICIPASCWTSNVLNFILNTLWQDLQKEFRILQ